MASRPVLDLTIRHWRLIGIVAVLGVLLGVGVSYLMPATYTVHVQLFVASNGSNTQDRAQNGEYVRTRVPTYAGLVTSPAVLDKVRQNLGIPAGESLAQSIGATNPLDTMLINISVTDPSARRAESVARATGVVASTVIPALEAPPGAGSPANVEVVQPATTPTGSDGRSRAIYAVAGLVVGLLVGAGIASLSDVRRKRRRAVNGHVNGVPVVSTSRHDREAEVGAAHRPAGP